MADLVPHIYHETQEPGSMLCGQHALNNLLQSSLFTAPDLADIARQLDALELAQLAPGERFRGDEYGGGGSANYDDSGFFSVQVMEEALKVLGLRLIRWGSKEMASAHQHPESIEGFLLNHQLHWFSIRRFGTPERFYNLDSCKPRPQWVSAMYLGLTLREAERQGYSIFAVVPSPDAHVAGLPPCAAAELALALPEPRGASTSYNPHGSGSTSNGSNGSSTHTYFDTASSARKGKRRASGRASDTIRDGISGVSDDDVVVEDPAVSSSSGRRQRQRRRVEDAPNGSPSRPGELDNPREMSEEEMMAAAIAASLKVSSSGETSQRSGSAAGANATASGSVQTGQSEEEELQRALQASMAEANRAQQEASEEPEEEDSPSLEELRRRRTARFG